jgi:hypothetical protein
MGKSCPAESWNLISSAFSRLSSSVPSWYRVIRPLKSVVPVYQSVARHSRMNRAGSRSGRSISSVTHSPPKVSASEPTPRQRSMRSATRFFGSKWMRASTTSEVPPPLS